MDNYKVIFLQARAVENILRLIKKNGLTSNLTCVIGHMIIIICLIYIAFPKLKDAVQKQKHNRQSIHIIVRVLSQSNNQLSGQ